MSQPKSEPTTDKNPPRIDFAIITAVKTEREAVLQAFELTADNRAFRGTRTYWRGRLPLRGGSFYEIVVAQSLDAASVDAALITNDTLHHWTPGALLLVGFAGAAHDGSKHDHEALGDLILASDVYYYERGKEGDNGKLPEPKMHKPDALLWNRATTLPEWTMPAILARRPDRADQGPRVFEGVIASGERVIANGKVREGILNQHRKIRAIEMEGFGFSEAAWSSVGNVPHLVMKSICDRADNDKNDDWQPYAAAVAAGFARYFLLDSPIAPRNLPEPSNDLQSEPKQSAVNKDWEAQLPKINYTRAFSYVRRVLSKIATGGCASFLLTESLMLGGEWCIEEIKSMVRENSRTFHYYPIEISLTQLAQERQVMLALGNWLDLKSETENLELYTDSLVDHLAKSFQVGKSVMIKLTISDDLERNKSLIAWLQWFFWKPLVGKIRILRETIPSVKCVFLISVKGHLSNSALKPSFLCNSYRFDEEKIVQLPLGRWRVEEIKNWLYKFAPLELNSSGYDQLATSIHKVSGNGVPLAVYKLLLDTFEGQLEDDVSDLVLEPS